MTITQIFNGTATNGIGTTVNFKKAVALYMVAPDITDEIEIDFYLQFAISPTDNRLLKLNDSFTLDTVSIYAIPLELSSLDQNFYGVFTTSSNISIEIYAIEGQNNFVCDFEEILQEIQDFRNQFTIEQARNIATDISFAIAETQQNIALSLLATSLSPLTVGASLSVFPPLTTATSILAPIALGGTLLLP